MLELRDEFLSKHMRGTAIELRNRQNTGWVQKGPEELLGITYPTADVQRSLEAISGATPGKPIVFLGQRGRGKSHIMALLHHAFEAPDPVEAWSKEWGGKLQTPRLSNLKLQRGFRAISETMSNQEYANLWELIFDRHPEGAYFRGMFVQSGTSVPAKSLLQDMFARQHIALILDEFQTWFDGLHDDPGDTGPKRRQWAFNFIQTLSELATQRPDLFVFIVSVRDNTTDAFKQIHRDGPILVDFKGETAKDDRKRLLLHRLFKNRDQFGNDYVERTVDAYARERNRLLYTDEIPADHARRRREVVDSWPFSPELLVLLEDNILLAEAAQETRDLIRVLAEVFRARGQQVPVVTAADFEIDNDTCGVTSLIDSFATTADQEHLREKAQRNLKAITDAGIAAPNARGVISSIWMRSLSMARTLGGTKPELQLDITRGQPVDDNAFTAEVVEIVDNSFNIHTLEAGEKRFCFKLEENPLSKLKAWARNDRVFAPQTAAAPGLLAVRSDQDFLRKTLEHLLRSPDSAREQPSRVMILDPNWEKAPWANCPQQDLPERWDRQVLLVLPIVPADISQVLGPWLAAQVNKNRNMVRFLLPKAETTNLYDDRDLVILARCTMLAKEWKETEPQYAQYYKKFDGDLRKELAERFNRYAMLARWDYQDPTACAFHIEEHGGSGAAIPAAVEKHARDNFFAPEDFEAFIIEAAKRSDTMSQVLALLRDPSPGVNLIPYLGDHAIYEQVLRVVARDKIAVNRNGTWYAPEAGQSVDEAWRALKQKAFPTGSEWSGIQLGMPSERGSSGVAVAGQQGSLFGGGPTTTGPTAPPSAASTGPTAGPTSPPPTVTPPGPSGPGITPPVVPAPPIIRKSLGAKTGINLLGDLEKWALPDAQRVTQALLTFSGLSVKDLRELCTKLPPKLAAELQITLPPDGSANGGSSV